MPRRPAKSATGESPGFPLRDSQPVVFMSLNDAKAYCESIGARVPLESEWEYAARAGSTTYHYWGEEIDDRYLWYFNNTDQRPEPVGRKLPNAWGLYDMEGNAMEWVQRGPHSSITRDNAGSVRGGSYATCPEPYPPAKGQRAARPRSRAHVPAIQEQHVPSGGTALRLRHSLREIGYQWLRRNAAASAMASRATRRIPGMVKKPWIVPG